MTSEHDARMRALRWLVRGGDRDKETIAGLSMLLDQLRRDRLDELLAEADYAAPPKSTKKANLLDQLARSASRELLDWLVETGEVPCQLQPFEVDELLGCTKAERKRWLDAGHLLVRGKGSFQYGEYDLYDAKHVAALAPEQIEQWRAEDKAAARERRKQSTSQRSSAREETLERVAAIEADLLWGESFGLAYWTFLANKRAGELRTTAQRSRTRAEEHLNRAQSLEALVEESLPALYAAPNVQILASTLVPSPLLRVQGAEWEPNFEPFQPRSTYLFRCDAGDFGRIDIAISWKADPSWLPVLVGTTSRSLLVDSCSQDIPTYDFTPAQIEKQLRNRLEALDDDEITQSVAAKRADDSQKGEAWLAERARNRAAEIEAMQQKVFAEYDRERSLWLSEYPDLVPFFELARWTRLLSRAAKTVQKGGAKDKSNSLYALKNRAIAVLNACPSATLVFYRPLEPDKVEYGDFYRDWYTFDDEYLKPERKEISRIPDFYSLFFTEIDAGTQVFGFHTPFTLGKSFYPPESALPQVNHAENGSGTFRFGKPLELHEQLAFSLSEIVAGTEAAIAACDPKRCAEMRERKFAELAARAEVVRQYKQAHGELETAVEDSTAFEEALWVLLQQADDEEVPRKQRRAWVAERLRDRLLVPGDEVDWPELDSQYRKKVVESLCEKLLKKVSVADLEAYYLRERETFLARARELLVPEHFEARPPQLDAIATQLVSEFPLPPKIQAHPKFAEEQAREMALYIAVKLLQEELRPSWSASLNSPSSFSVETVGTVGCFRYCDLTIHYATQDNMWHVWETRQRKQKKKKKKNSAINSAFASPQLACKAIDERQNRGISETSGQTQVEFLGGGTFTYRGCFVTYSPEKQKRYVYGMNWSDPGKLSKKNRQLLAQVTTEEEAVRAIDDYWRSQQVPVARGNKEVAFSGNESRG